MLTDPILLTPWWLNFLSLSFGGTLKFSRKVPEYLEQGPEWHDMTYLDPARLWQPLQELKQSSNNSNNSQKLRQTGGSVKVGGAIMCA